MVSIIDTIMKSKENDILKLFFEEPAKEWHFKDILKEGHITKSKADGWLKYFIKNEFIKRVKEKDKMPYYIANYESASYKNKKKLFALNRFYEIGLLNHLVSLKKAKTIILFGSFSRWDWYKNSDIDIFIYGNPEGLKVSKYELKLNKEIQLFMCKDKKELRKYGDGLIRNILKGEFIKGDLDFIEVNINA